MKSVIFVLIILTTCSFNDKQICALMIDCMDTAESRLHLGDPSMPVSSTGILKSHCVGSYMFGKNKTVILSAPSGYSIFADVRLLDLRPNKQDILTLFANKTAGPRIFANDHSFQFKEFDSQEDLKKFYAPDGQLGVNFVTGSNSGTWGYQGFEVVYTVQASGIMCRYDYFMCSNAKCINRNLKCDGHNHCGDRSDQKYCYFPDPPVRSRNARVAGIVTGVVFLLIAVACVIYIMIRRVKLRKIETRTVSSQYPPSTNIQGYPPPYSEAGNIYPPPPPPYSPYQGVTNPGYH